jgi:hypothetical protein
MNETVGVKNIFLDVQRCIAPLQIPSAIPFDSMAQYQILRPRRRANRIGLNKSHSTDRGFQCGWMEKRLGNGVCTQSLERQHAQHIKRIIHSPMRLNPGMERHSLKSGRWILALTVVVLFSYWKLVFTKQFSILWQWELVSQSYSWYTYTAQWIHKGIVPIWDPFRYGGNSFIGEMQNGLFYPFKLALYLAPLDSNGLLSERAFNLFYVFSHWLAAVCMFALARYLKLSNFAALVAGICFGLGGFIQWTAWLNILDAMPWLPLIVLFLLRAFDSDRTAGYLGCLINACVAGLALGMTFLAGSLHIAIMDAIVVATLSTYLYFTNPKRNLPRAAIVVAAIAITSLLVGAVQLWPSFEYSPLAGSAAIRRSGHFNESPIRSWRRTRSVLNLCSLSFLVR